MEHATDGRSSGKKKCGETFPEMGISREEDTKIPHNWKVQSWGNKLNLIYSSEEQTVSIQPSFCRP